MCVGKQAFVYSFIPEMDLRQPLGAGYGGVIAKLLLPSLQDLKVKVKES